ncbi:MAG: helix-turn-helix transcriptional regulator [Fidelibacterota bacterium]|nr:MAG: helix-turn-helix transcriptional regulator [Candidatus Neomarinimicrobiota bacterium]
MTTNFTWQFGERFRQIRRAARITQEEFGEILGVSRQTINAYENDRQRPPLDMMEKVCHLQGISPHWLLTGRGESRLDTAFPSIEGSGAPISAMEEVLAPEQRALINYITEDKARAVKLARYLLDEALRHLPTAEGEEKSGDQ